MPKLPYIYLYHTTHHKLAPPMTYTIDQPEFPVLPTHELLFLGDRNIALPLESLFEEQEFSITEIYALTLREDALKVLHLLHKDSPWTLTLLVKGHPAYRASVVRALKGFGVPYDELIISVNPPSYTVHNRVSFDNFEELADKLHFPKQH